MLLFLNINNMSISNKWPQEQEEIIISGRKFKVVEITVTEHENKCAILQFQPKEGRPPDEADFYRIIRRKNNAAIQYCNPKPNEHYSDNIWDTSEIIEGYFK